tara:strand:+ start:12220 stop:12417 length:198 start_codon:yes stop_codon:yes gene_type:complete
MFEVFMLVCALSTDGKCIGVTDDYGPYKNYTRCIIRAEQMRDDAHDVFPFPINVTYGCKNLGEKI